MDLEYYLKKSAEDHDHLCPRQVLGVRIGLAGLEALGFSEPPKKKRLMVICETDGCFVDGVTSVTNCTVGHRTLRIEDYGKIAATFIDVNTEQAIRIAPHPQVRERAYAYVPQEKRHYFAQLYGYQIMPVEELLVFETVNLQTPVAQIIGKLGVRVNCAICGEEIINQREIIRDGMTICRACAGESYYQSSPFVEVKNPIHSTLELFHE